MWVNENKKWGSYIYNSYIYSNFKEEKQVNKADLISRMADKSELNKKQTEAALKAFVESVEEALESGDKVQLVGFGTFETRERAERTGRWNLFCMYRCSCTSKGTRLETGVQCACPSQFQMFPKKLWG